MAPVSSKLIDSPKSPKIPAFSRFNDEPSSPSHPPGNDAALYAGESKSDGSDDDHNPAAAPIAIPPAKDDSPLTPKKPVAPKPVKKKIQKFMDAVDSKNCERMCRGCEDFLAYARIKKHIFASLDYKFLFGSHLDAITRHSSEEVKEHADELSGFLQEVGNTAYAELINAETIESLCACPKKKAAMRFLFAIECVDIDGLSVVAGSCIPHVCSFLKAERKPKKVLDWLRCITNLLSLPQVNVVYADIFHKAGGTIALEKLRDHRNKTVRKMVRKVEDTVRQFLV